MDLKASSLLAFLPWLVMAMGSSLSGLLADALVARGVKVVTVRKALQSVAFLVPAVALLLLAQPNISPQVRRRGGTLWREGGDAAPGWWRQLLQRTPAACLLRGARAGRRRAESSRAATTARHFAKLQCRVVWVQQASA